MKASRRGLIASPDKTSWVSGAYLEHDATQVAGWGAFRKRSVGVITVFPSHATTGDLTDFWWLTSSVIPAGYKGAISVRWPMCADTQDATADISAATTAAANAMQSFNSGLNTYYIAIGWEMNHDGWAWHITDDNLPTWRTRFATYSGIFTSILGSRAKIGFNPNGGANAPGTLSTPITDAYVAGSVHWAGSDQYDDYPAFTSDSNVNTQLTRSQGLNYWANFCRTNNLKLAFPEYGVSSGDQWAGNTGNDNPRYIREMHKVMRRNRGIMLFDSYFNEPASELKSTLWRPSVPADNPNSAAVYRELWAK